MLTQLSIRNFGLIPSLTLEFTGHLNILTGETGAGKSILIDALRFGLGERLQGTQIRDADQNTTVQTVFDLAGSDLLKHPLLEEFFSEGDPQLIIQRTHKPDGRNLCKINGLTVTTTQLKECGALLIDFHGPHDHQSLFSEDNHIRILDQLTSFGPEYEAYTTSYSRFKELKHQLKTLHESSQNRSRDLDILSHQIQELEQVPLTQEAYDEISAELTRVNNAEELYTYTSELTQILEDEEAGADAVISRAFRPIHQLVRLDESAQSLLEQLNLTQETLQQLMSDLSAYQESLTFNPRQAEDINTRYSIYHDILRKYGPAITDAQIFYEKAKERHDMLANLEHNDAALREEIAGLEASLGTLAASISASRKKTADKLKKTIEKELKELGFHHVQFEVRLIQTPLESRGHDAVAFYISPNAGEDIKPLAQIVSSGEAARIMLALKKALVAVDPVPVLIFDEIDAQIGGRLGTITGRKLKEIADQRQVILITHLPQIASFAETHYKITKAVEDNRAVTRVTRLDESTRVQELAQMMSGDQTHSDASLTHAQDMFEKARR